MPKEYDETSVLSVMNEWQFIREYFGHFGARRGFEILGFAAMMVLIGEDRTIPELVKAMKENGVCSQASVYRSVTDLQKFADKLEERYKGKVTVPEVTRKLATIESSRIREAVV